MQVREIMYTRVITVRRSYTLRLLLETFANFHLFPLVAVVEADGRLVGIVSFHNLLNAFHPKEPEILKSIPFLDKEEEDIFTVDITKELGNLVVVEDIMESQFVKIREDASLQDAYNLMRLHLKEEVPVVDKDDKLVGMIGIFDIVRQVFHEKGIV